MINQQIVKQHYGIDATCYPKEYNISLDSKKFYQPGDGLLICTDQFIPLPSMAVPFYKNRLRCLEFAYFISGDARFTVATKHGCKKKMGVHSGMRTGIFNTEVRGVIEAADTTEVQSLFIYIAPEKILAFTGEENQQAATRLFSQTQKNRGYTRPSIISPAMTTIVYEIFNCHFHGVAKKMFVEGKILELMAHEIDSVDAPTNRAAHIDKDHIQQLQKAREIMMENMVSPPSIQELASLVGLNPKKIKMGFRRLYNTTVFGFLRQYCMEQARMLFETHEANVTEAASAVGYTNISHFSAAFRNHFGIRPSDYLKFHKTAAIFPQNV